MNLIFDNPKSLQRMREGPLGLYVDFSRKYHATGESSFAS